MNPSFVSALWIAVLLCLNAKAEISDSVEIGGKRVFTGGPIRHEPAFWGNRVFVGSDDGYLYCFDKSGEELWRFRGGPTNRKALGAGRLISAWPISGGPVTREGRVFFAAGIWPFMGVFVYALDAKSGEVIWINDRATTLWKSPNISEQRPDQPEFEPSFISVTPMGQLRFDEETGDLLVPCGRAEPARFDPATGELREFHYGRHKPHEQGEGNLLYPNYDDVVAQSRAALPAANPRIRQLLENAGINEEHEGYCVVAGADVSLITGLVAGSRLRIVVIDPDKTKIEELRKLLHKAGAYGSRVSAHVGDLREFHLPPYFASLIFAASAGEDRELAQAAFEALRPYGGVAILDPDAEVSSLKEGEFERKEDSLIVRRTGALPGSDSWSHEFANASNTQSTSDALAKSPFAVLWFGGPAAEVHRYYENHRQWAIPKVAGGRLFVEGPKLISVFDVYTGRFLWEWKPPENDNEPWSYAANGVHLAFEPLAGRTAATEDAFYIVSDKRLFALDAETGDPLAGFKFHEQADWGGVRLEEENLYLATASRVVAINRRTGKQAWEWTGTGGSLAIGGGRAF